MYRIAITVLLGIEIHTHRLVLFVSVLTLVKQTHHQHHHFIVALLYHSDRTGGKTIRSNGIESVGCRLINPLSEKADI